MRPRAIKLPIHQRGAALFVAIFLITVVVLAAAIVTLTSVTQHTGQVRAGQADQAWYAALARLESETSTIVANDSCPAGGTQLTFGFSTTLSCSRVEVREGNIEYAVFNLETTASRGNAASGNFVRRSARAQIISAEAP